MLMSGERLTSIEARASLAAQELLHHLSRHAAFPAVIGRLERTHGMIYPLQVENAVMETLVTQANQR
jgi:hypothetical protein